jgi:hypothetical protein
MTRRRTHITRDSGATECPLCAQKAVLEATSRSDTMRVLALGVQRSSLPSVGREDRPEGGKRVGAVRFSG